MTGASTHFKHMALPTIALALGLAATYMRVLRSDMIATLQENFITTAKAKGVSDRRILWAHALRPSSFTLMTLFGITTGTLIGGALIIETIFTLPGLGTHALHGHLLRRTSSSSRASSSSSPSASS